MCVVRVCLLLLFVFIGEDFFFCVCLFVVVVCFYRGRVSFFVCVVCVCLLLLFVFIGGGFPFLCVLCVFVCCCCLFL